MIPRMDGGDEPVNPKLPVRLIGFVGVADD
jgi:hypothetical protein